MIIIFQCYGGTHTSIVAASLYLGVLSRSGPPCSEELATLPYYDRMDSNEIGKIHYLGADHRDNLVFAVGSASWGAPIREMMAAYLSLAGDPAPQVAVIDCLPHVNTITRIGGFISRRLGLTRLGRPLVNLGIRRGYAPLLGQVEAFIKNPTAFTINRSPVK